MSRHPETLAVSATLRRAAQMMHDFDIGEVVVMANRAVAGVVTDRDIVVRAVAEGADPNTTSCGDIASTELISVSPSDPIADTVTLMRQHAIRRLPVIDNETLVGIVSLGDLAREPDTRSALADISATPPNA